MPNPTEVDLTIHNLPLETFEELEQIAGERNTTVEELTRQTLANLIALRNLSARFNPSPERKDPTHRRSLTEVMASIKATREEIAQRGPILEPGETYKELGRKGLR